VDAPDCAESNETNMQLPTTPASNISQVL